MLGAVRIVRGKFSKYSNKSQVLRFKYYLHGDGAEGVVGIESTISWRTSQTAMYSWSCGLLNLLISKWLRWRGICLAESRQLDPSVTANDCSNQLLYRYRSGIYTPFFLRVPRWR
jgi:hypothetical protein